MMTVLHDRCVRFPPGGDYPGGGSATAGGTVMAGRLGGLVLRAVRLSAIYREPLVLCYLEGLTRDEAAARLGVRGVRQPPADLVGGSGPHPPSFLPRAVHCIASHFQGPRGP
jgi:hypothetical protein